MNKRFTLCEEQEYTDGWSIGITDHQTKEPFDSSSYMFHSSKQSATKEEMEDLIMVINQLADENEQLKQRIDVLNDQITAQGIVIDGYQNRNQKLFDENEQLKKELLELHEICAYYESRIKELKGDVE